MSFLDNVKKIFAKKDTGDVESKESMGTVKNWYSDQYEKVVIQRNLLLVVTVLSIALILFSVILIRYFKDTSNVEPFVIEIEKKTGVPTVIDPVSFHMYSSNESVLKYFLVKYLKAREEYTYNSYKYNYGTTVRLLSSSSVYRDYRRKNSVNNPNSPRTLYAQGSNINIRIKSINFRSKKLADIRFVQEVRGGVNKTMDKVASIEFSFKNIKMSEDDRLINPLGFNVTLYKAVDENV